MSVTPIFQNGGFGLKRECSSHPNHQSIAWLLLVIIDLFFIQMSISIIKYQVKALKLQKSFKVLSLKIVYAFCLVVYMANKMLSCKAITKIQIFS